MKIIVQILTLAGAKQIQCETIFIVHSYPEDLNGKLYTLLGCQVVGAWRHFRDRKRKQIWECFEKGSQGEDVYILRRKILMQSEHLLFD